MNAYNPLESMKRLEQAGLTRQHAEAIAAKINEGTSDLVTKDYFKEQLAAALDRATIRLSVIMAGMITLACTMLGLFLSN